MTVLRMKIAGNELVIESSSSISTGELDDAMSAFARFRDMLGAQATPASPKQNGPDAAAEVVANGELDASIDMVVARLGGDSARAILKSAAVHLTLVEGQTVFSRDAWFARAHGAHEWRAEHSRYQARDLRRMVVSKEIIEKQGGMYALPPKVLAEARAKLVDD